MHGLGTCVRPFFFYDNARVCLIFFRLRIFQIADTNFELMNSIYVKIIRYDDSESKVTRPEGNR